MVEKFLRHVEHGSVKFTSNPNVSEHLPNPDH
jgi:hypothetical protein